MFTRTESLTVYAKRYPLTLSVIGICSMLFMWMTLVGSSTSTDTLHQFGAMYRPSIEDGEWYRFLSANFLHIGLLHLLTNMVFMYVFGAFIEARLGKWRYLVFFLFSGAGSMALPFLLSDGVTAGLSGVLFAMVGMYVYLLQTEPHHFSVSDKQTILMLLIISVIYSFLQPNVSVEGHLGGFVFGWLLSFIFLKKRKKQDKIKR